MKNVRRVIIFLSAMACMGPTIRYAFGDTLANHEPGAGKTGDPNILLHMIQYCLDLAPNSPAAQCQQCPSLPDFSRLNLRNHVGQDLAPIHQTIVSAEGNGMRGASLADALQDTPTATQASTVRAFCSSDPRWNESSSCTAKMEFWDADETEYFAQDPASRSADSPFARYLAIQDIKMCQCSQKVPGSIGVFFHGLVIPREPMTGVEEQGKFAEFHDAWAVAWKLGLEKTDENSLVLAANPPIANKTRSQNQLHIHMVRLRPGARAAIDQQVLIDRCAVLDGCVWDKVRQLAAKAGYVADTGEGHGYGVAVMRATDGNGWTVAVVGPDVSPEEDFTQNGYASDGTWKLQCAVKP